MLKVLVLVAFGYLLGSVPSGWLVMKVYRNQDVRKLGSGNIGAANVLRAGGPGAFATTLIADGLKGFIPVMIGIALGLGDNEIALAAIGLAAVIGHNWPLYLRFKGGKGVATAFGALFALWWPAGLAFVVVWIAAVVATGYASVGSMLASIAMAPVLWFGLGPIGLAYGILSAILIVTRHRENIERLRRGTENRLSLLKAKRT